jgi:hypothetical protein
MKTFKLTDFYIQVIVIAMSLLLTLTGVLNFYTSYFIVGSFQLSSMLIHEITRSFIAKGSARRLYQNVVYFIVGCMLITPLINAFAIIFFPMAFLAPFMAVYYTGLCYKETFVYMKRPLSVLK